MGFLKRLFGGNEPEPPEPDQVDDREDDHAREATSAPGPSAAVSARDEEQARDRELLREEARRLSDDLIQRQLRYADRSWTPPPQGGERRAEDDDSKGESGQ